MFDKIDPQSWKADLPEFREKTAAFYEGTMSKGDYKGFSGYYGSYAQKSGTASMLRLRMTGGRVTKEKLAYVTDMIRKYDVKKAHFTTCETIQLHDLGPEAVCDIMEGALDVGIVTIGGGGDFPRNIMCSPLSGVEKEEYFDVLPYAELMGEYMMNYVKAEKMPRKLKICFSNSPANIPHATFRDLGFAAREDGKFDVYSAGGLGNNPKFGVLIKEAVEPDQILYYARAMWKTFRTYGNYENRGKARTRYMQDIVGGPEKYKEAFLKILDEVYAEGNDLSIQVETKETVKSGDGTTISSPRVLEQKQPGLYTVVWHPIGGQPSMKSLCALSNLMKEIPETEMRLSADETAYIINLTASEAQKVMEATPDSAETLFESSVSCVGASICQVGLRDSQALLAASVKAVREAGIPDGALPRIHISGCPSSCGTHQIGDIGFRGATKKGVPGFLLFINGCDLQGQERMGREAGVLDQNDVPRFLVELGNTVASAGMKYAEWYAANPEAIDKIVEKYV